MSLTPGRFAAPGGPTRSGETTTLSRYWTTIRSHWLVIIVITALGIAGAVAYVALAHKTYTATSNVVVTPESQTNTITSALPILQSSGDPTQDVLTASTVFHTPAIAQATVSALHLSTSSDDLLGKVSIIPVDQSNVLAISATAGTAAGAQSIANAYARAIIAVRTAGLHAAIRRQLPSLRASAASVPAAQRYGAGSVGQEITELEQMLAAPDPTVTLSSTASLPGAPTSPKRDLALLAGLLVGLLIGVGAAIGLETLDPRIRREGQLRERFPSAPVLARVPRRGGRVHYGPLTPADLNSAAMEQYRTLRAELLVDENGGDGSRAVLVASTGPSEGKSTTAISLAAVLAQGGARVILIDADLRRPSLGDALGVSRFQGTADVLAGEAKLSEALVPVTLGPATLDVLFAHKESADSAGQLSESSARRLVEEAKRIADFVILDSSPLLLVADALVFARAADDVVLIARAEQTRLSKLDKAWDLILRQHARVSGFILIGVTADRDLYYGYGPSGDLNWKPAQPARRPKRSERSERTARQTLEK